VGERKHRRLISDSLSLAEMASDGLKELRSAARNDDTKAFIQSIEIKLLNLQPHLYQMMELTRDE
jgi:hypothetical protein